MKFLSALLALSCSTAATWSAEIPVASESTFLSGTRQLTFEGKRSGEGYFSADGSQMIFQSEREEGNPFYQIYLMDLATGDQQRVSPGVGKTTCAWIHPDGKRVMFASTHLDAEAKAKQAAEIEERKNARVRRYSWDYDETRWLTSR
jgi:Tol biopolymer transport system component